jgi:hypothetical protein
MDGTSQLETVAVFGTLKTASAATSPVSIQHNNYCRLRIDKLTQNYRVVDTVVVWSLIVIPLPFGITL